MTRLMSAQEWRVVLRALGERLPGPCDVTLIGGAAMALAHGVTRRTTRDVDVVFEPGQSTTVLKAAQEVAVAFDLEPGWLNDDAVRARYVPEHTAPNAQVVETLANLTIRAASPLAMLAMKLTAWRDAQDRDDARDLLNLLRGRYFDAAEVWNVVGGLVPLDKRARAEENLEDAGEMADAAP